MFLTIGHHGTEFAIHGTWGASVVITIGPVANVKHLEGHSQIIINDATRVMSFVLAIIIRLGELVNVNTSGFGLVLNEFDWLLQVVFKIFTIFYRSEEQFLSIGHHGGW